MDVMVRPFMMFVLFTATIACACSREPPQPVRGVAIVGDTPVELRNGIAAAEEARQNPVFVAVRNGPHVYVFSPYAQVLRGDGALIVRAFSAILTFPLTATVTFGGRAVDVAVLPHVSFGARPGQRLDARALSQVTDSWNGLKDPWQHANALKPWTKGAILDAQSTELDP